MKICEAKICLCSKENMGLPQMPTADHNHCLWTVAATMMS